MNDTLISLQGPVGINIYDVAAILKKELGADLLAEIARGNEEVRTLTLAFEQFYFRSKSYMGLVVVLTKMDGMITADITCVGGGNGVLSITWGANDSFVQKASKLLQEYEFSIIS